jgi:hypothetical protein
LRPINLADVATFRSSLKILFEEVPMRDSMESHDTRRWFMPEPDSIEGSPLVCRRCASDLTLHQPDPEMPERLLGTCGDCKTWYLLTDELEYVEIAPGRTNRGEACPPDIPSALSYAARRRNGVA